MLSLPMALFWGLLFCGRMAAAETPATDTAAAVLFPAFQSGSMSGVQSVVFAVRSIRDAQAQLNQINRFDMPGFQPRPEYVREMRRYGILSARDSAAAPVDPYATDRAYWESLWYRASSLRTH